MKLSPKFKIGIIITLLIALFTILNLTPAKKETKNFFYLISSPVQKALWRIGDNISDFFEMVKEIKNLKKENEELKLKIVGLLAENTRLEELKRENEVLREALDIGLEKEFKLKMAKILGEDISPDMISIDKGLKDGFIKGLPIITEQKILVGKISEVYENFSKVMLISNKESSFSAKIQEKDIEGLVRGKENFRISLEFVPREKELSEGDIVVSSVLGGVFPENLLVGEIVKIKKSDIEPFQEAQVKSFFDIKKIKDLFIILEWQKKF